MVPMSVGLVSLTVVHDNTSGHLHVVVHGEDRPTLDEACSCDTSYYYYKYTYHILCVKTISVNQDLTQDLPLRR